MMRVSVQVLAIALCNSQMVQANPQATMEDAITERGNFDGIETAIVLIGILGWWLSTFSSPISRLLYCVVVGGLGIVMLLTGTHNWRVYSFITTAVISWFFGKKG